MKQTPIFRRFRDGLLSILCLITLSCGNPPSSTTSAYVTPEMAARAFEVISRIDYLPFGFKYEGCAERSLFMAMELAVERIPSSAQFVLGDIVWDAEDPNMRWSHHVAPMLMVGIDPEPIVIDRSVLSAPAKRSEWIKKLRADGTTDNLTLVAVPGSYFARANPPRPSEERVILTFTDLPQFDASKIGPACRALRRYIRYQGGNDVDAKRDKLARRANKLATRLDRLGKLKKAPGEGRFVVDCGDSW